MRHTKLRVIAALRVTDLDIVDGMEFIRRRVVELAAFLHRKSACCDSGNRQIECWNFVQVPSVTARKLADTHYRRPTVREH
jgi:hypothetical protein